MDMQPELNSTPNLVLPKLSGRPWWKRAWLWVVVVFLAVWFGLPLVLQPFMKQGQVTTGTNQLTKFSGSTNTPANTTYDVITPSSPTLGPVTAPVTIVEFGDFQCPFCRAAEPILKQVLAKYPEAVRLMYRNLPLNLLDSSLHPEATNAAEAAACAAVQGKFWPYHDQLYQNQDALGESIYTSLATSLALDLVEFNRCRQNHLTLNTIQADAQAAVAAGAQGTPTFYVNGHRIAGVVPLDLWDKIIAAALREKFGR